MTAPHRMEIEFLPDWGDRSEPSLIQAGIVHAHPFLRWAVQQALSLAPDVEVRSVQPGLHPGPPDGLDVLLLDLCFAAEAGCAELIARLAPDVRVLMVGGTERPEELTTCLEAGAMGRLDERSTPGALLEAVRTVMTEEPVAESAAKSTLSSRERQVLQYIAGGFTHDQTARRLGISRHTVDTYVKRVRVKLGVGNKAELTRAAVADGLGRAS